MKTTARTAIMLAVIALIAGCWMGCATDKSQFRAGYKGMSETLAELDRAEQNDLRVSDLHITPFWRGVLRASTDFANGAADREAMRRFLREHPLKRRTP